jgi:hypothetical protein
MTDIIAADALLERVNDVTTRLTEADIWHEVRFFREDGVSILAHVPGEYWEIDVLTDGSIDVEVFRTTGELEDEAAVDRLIKTQGIRTQ